MDDGETRAFARSPLLVWSWLVLSVGSVVVAAVDASQGNYLGAVAWAVLGVLWLARLRHDATTPYLVISPEGLSVDQWSAPLIAWNAIVECERVGDSSLVLRTADGGTSRVSLRTLPRDERDFVASAIQARVGPDVTAN